MPCFIEYAFLDASCSRSQPFRGYSCFSKGKISTHLEWLKEYRIWGIRTCCFTDQKISLIFPQVSWLLPRQEPQFLITSTKVISVQQTLGWFSEVRNQVKDSGGFFQLWIIETKKEVYLYKIWNHIYCIKMEILQNVYGIKFFTFFSLEVFFFNLPSDV